jgi:glycosyltransferase involved in cell wall biosynthesis
MKQPKISVILTCWQRPHLLEEQVERIYAQSVQPHEVILWYNAPPKRFGFIERKQLVEFKNDGQVKKILCSHNLGIIPRFTLASCLEGEYICIFDDDTMPGKLWFENCLTYVDSQQTLCGTIGLRYLSTSELLTEKPRMGWEGKNEHLEFVDLVGHSWFFRREWARFFWDQEPPSRTFGEDIHFCAMLQRHDIRVACPPHPMNQPNLWGSTQPHLGVDKVAISCSSDKSAEFWRVVKHEFDNGYKPVLL